MELPTYPAKAELLSDDELSQWFAGKRGRAFNIIPFYGPIKGKDLDAEYFSPRTDPKPDWFNERPVPWHHGKDPTGVMGDLLMGKAVGMVKKADGWWSDVWLNLMDKRLALVEDLARKAMAKGHDLMGSTQPIQTFVRKATDGEILVWPVAEFSLTVSPQNIWSRPAKAMLDDFETADIELPGSLRAFLAHDEQLAAFKATIDNLGSDLPSTSGQGEMVAKAGRVLSARNERALRDALELFASLLDSMAQRPILPPTEGDALS